MKGKVIFEIECDNSAAIRHAFSVCLETIVFKKLKINNWKLYAEPEKVEE